MSKSTDDILILHNRLLLELSQFIGANETWNYIDVAQKIITLAVQGLHLPRVSIWQLNDTFDVMEAVAIWIDGSFNNTSELKIQKKDYPTYFDALHCERFIVADDARTHPDTAEFNQSYLTPSNIYSMLDAPIRKNGKIVGILCCEQTEHPRSWSLLEQSFAAMLADSASRALAEESARNALDALKHSFYTDPLTGLPNRVKLIEDLKTTNKCALAVFDIDGFTNINDFYGYEVGNHILQKVGPNILLSTQGAGSLYRYNSDKFALLMDNISEEGFLYYVKSILDHTQTYAYTFEGFTISLKLSAVVSFESQNNIVHSIDILLKELKKQNVDFMTYDKSLGLEKEISNNILWNKKIKDALLEDRFINYYQPILNNITRKIEKYESLVRMVETDGTIVSPFHFLEIAKRSKQYISITQKVIDNSFKMFQDENAEFSINLTIEDILEPKIRELLHSKMFDLKYFNQVVYEIVESEELEKADVVFEFIRSIKAFGCKIAIDDFGTGYSNFEKLCKLTPDYIKIDASMIRDITTNKDNEELVKTIIDFAKKRNLKTIAEFVHSQEVFLKVCELGIDYSQGYYIGEPKPTLLKVFKES